MQKQRLVLRQRLLEVLDRWTGCRAIRIVAPGGFGKSTLCLQWMQRMASATDDQRPFTALLPLDASQGTLDVFLTRLAAAAGDALPPLHHIAALAGAGEMTVPRAAATLAKAVAASPRPIVLILDDLHLVPPGPVLDLLQSLLDDDIHNLHLALVSRSHSALDLSELLIRGKVLSLTIDDLVFDAAEFTAFAEAHQLTTLPGSDLAQIHRRSGGWAAGLQLLVQALPASRTLTIDALRAAEAAPDLWKYVERAIFNRTSRHVSFITETALLPWLSPELCAGITDRSMEECTLLLEEIAATNGLVTPRHISEKMRYYVHPVLQEILMRKLSGQRSAAALEELRRRATRLLVADGEVDAALAMLGLPHTNEKATRSTHNIDIPFICDLLETACRPTLLRSDVAAVRRWLSCLDESAIRARPQLAIDATWAAYHLLDSHVHAYLQRARQSLQAHPHPPELDAELATLETLAALHAGRNHLAYHHLQHAYSLPCSPDGLVAAYLPAIRGYLMFGEPRSREQRHADTEEAYAAFTRLGHMRGRIEALVVAQWVHTMYADSAAALMTADRVHRLLLESGMEGSTFGLYSHLYAAQLLYFTNQIPAAKQRLQRIIELTGNEASSNVSPYHAQVRLQLCALAESEETELEIDPLDDAMQYREAIAHVSPIITAHTCLMRLLRDIRLGRSEHYMESVAIFDRTVDQLTPDDSPMVQLNVLLAAVAARRCDDDLLARISALRTQTENRRHYSNSMLLHILQALILQQRGSHAMAAEALGELLKDIERTGHLRYVLDFSPLLQQLLHAVGTPFAENLLLLESGSSGQSAFRLSNSEQRVLRQLASHMNAVQIAQTMHISVNTVRTHVRNIYRKLHVHNREEARIVAKKTGLL